MKDITVKPNITIQQAMKALNKASEKCLLVIDENNKLLGTLTDGDLRRSILSGMLFSENISNSFNTKPTVFSKEFQLSLHSTINPYGDGNATEKIMKKLILSNFPVSTIKQFYDL